MRYPIRTFLIAVFAVSAFGCSEQAWMDQQTWMGKQTQSRQTRLANSTDAQQTPASTRTNRSSARPKTLFEVLFEEPQPSRRNKSEWPQLRLVNADEVNLVEQVVQQRYAYFDALTQLRDYYRDRNADNKRNRVEARLAKVTPVQAADFISDGVVTEQGLQPLNNIATADEMYTHGLSLMEQGGYGTTHTFDQKLMREALQVFVSMIENYPSSDKIDDAAFCCGEIFRECFNNQEYRAIQWYQRAYTWDPQTPHAARFQVALIYDFRLHDRDKAIKVYSDIIECESVNDTSALFAAKRRQELMAGSDTLAEPRPASNNAPQDEIKVIPVTADAQSTEPAAVDAQVSAMVIVESNEG